MSEKLRARFAHHGFPRKSSSRKRQHQDSHSDKGKWSPGKVYSRLAPAVHFIFISFLENFIKFSLNSPPALLACPVWDGGPRGARRRFRVGQLKNASGAARQLRARSAWPAKSRGKHHLARGPTGVFQLAHVSGTPWAAVPYRARRHTKGGKSIEIKGNQ